MSEEVTVEEVTIEAPEEITAVVKREGLNDQSGKSLIAAFAPFHAQVQDALAVASGVTDGANPAHQKVARTCRLELRRVRCAIENARKDAKADALRYGKAVDGLANVLKFLCEPEEKRLEDIEKHAERIEAERIAALVEERTGKLTAVDADPAAYNLGTMDDATFDLVLDAATKARDARIEAERKAEADRIAREKAEAEERERIRAENAKLKAEAEAKEKELAAERARIEAERKKEREEAEAKAKAERDAAAKEMEKHLANIAREKRARDKAEADAAAARKAEADRIAKEKADAEVKAESERMAAESAARAPDRDKIVAFAATVRALDVPTAKTKAGKAVTDVVKGKVEAFAVWIEKQAEQL